MSRRNVFFVFFWKTLWVCGLAVALSAHAQVVQRVGRVAHAGVAAQFWDSRQLNWSPLFLNRAVMSGDRIRNDGAAPVEVDLGSLRIWVAPASEAEFTTVDPAQVQVRVLVGSVAAGVGSLEAARQLDLYTDEALLRPEVPGLYRVDRGAQGLPQTTAMALAGALQSHAAARFLDLRQGERWAFYPAAAGLQPQAVAPLGDAFQAWLVQPERMAWLQAPPPVVPISEIRGLEVLQQPGTWVRHAEWGLIWWPAGVLEFPYPREGRLFVPPARPPMPRPLPRPELRPEHRPEPRPEPRPELRPEPRPEIRIPPPPGSNPPSVHLPPPVAPPPSVGANPAPPKGAEPRPGHAPRDPTPRNRGDGPREKGERER